MKLNFLISIDQVIILAIMLKDFKIPQIHREGIATDV